MSQRVVTVTRVKRGEEPVDRSWLDRTADERMVAVWRLTLECLAWLPEKHEPRLQRSVVRVLRKGR